MHRIKHGDVVVLVAEHSEVIHVTVARCKGDARMRTADVNLCLDHWLRLDVAAGKNGSRERFQVAEMRVHGIVDGSPDSAGLRVLVLGWQRRCGEDEGCVAASHERSFVQGDGSLQRKALIGRLGQIKLVYVEV